MIWGPRCPAWLLLELVTHAISDTYSMGLTASRRELPRIAQISRQKNFPFFAQNYSGRSGTPNFFALCSNPPAFASVAFPNSAASSLSLCSATLMCRGVMRRLCADAASALLMSSNSVTRYSRIAAMYTATPSLRRYPGMTRRMWLRTRPTGKLMPARCCFIVRFFDASCIAGGVCGVGNGAMTGSAGGVTTMLISILHELYAHKRQARG